MSQKKGRQVADGPFAGSKAIAGFFLLDVASLEYPSVNTYRRNLEDWFSTFTGRIGYETRDLSITAGGDVALSHSLNRITGTQGSF